MAKPNKSDSLYNEISASKKSGLVRKIFLVTEIIFTKPSDDQPAKKRLKSSLRQTFRTHNYIRRSRYNIRLILDTGEKIEVAFAKDNVKKLIEDINKGLYRNRAIHVEKFYNRDKPYSPVFGSYFGLKQVNQYYLQSDFKLTIDNYWHNVQSVIKPKKTSAAPKKKDNEMPEIEITFEKVDQLSPNDDNIRRYGILNRFLAHGFNDELFAESDKIVIKEFNEMGDSQKKEYLEFLTKAYSNLDYQ